MLSLLFLAAIKYRDYRAAREATPPRSLLSRYPARRPAGLTLDEAVRWQLSNAHDLPGAAAVTLAARATLAKYSASEILAAGHRARGAWPGRPPRPRGPGALADLHLAAELLHRLLGGATGSTAGQLAADLCTVRSQLAVVEASIRSIA